MRWEDETPALQHLLDMLRNAHFVKHLAFRTVLIDARYASMSVMKAIEVLDKVYYAPLNRNRFVSISVDSGYQSVETWTWTAAEATADQFVHIKKFSKGHQMKAFRWVSDSGHTDSIATSVTLASKVIARHMRN